jgi:hypothetical protein
LANALTVPHAAAALVLMVAGLAKLRSPRAAARAVHVTPLVIRGFATFEVALGAWALVSGVRPVSVVMVLVYAGFALTTWRLARTNTACGCFGEQEDPASPIQSVVSVALALVCLVSALAAPHALGWILGRSAASATVLVLGTAGVVYGTVLAYSELPLLWRSWSPA